jgi:hypothetical protein
MQMKKSFDCHDECFGLLGLFVVWDPEAMLDPGAC